MADQRDRGAIAKKYALAVRAVLEGRIGVGAARKKFSVHSTLLLNRLKAQGYVSKRLRKPSKSMLNAVRAVVSGKLSRASAARKFGVNYDVLEGKIYDYRNGALKMNEKSPRKTTGEAASSPRSSKRVKQKENSSRDHLPSTSRASPSKRSSMITPLPTALVSSNQMPPRPQKLIESIIEVRTVRQYLIKWKNVPATGNTWELMENVNARIKNTNIVIPPIEDLIKTGNGSSAPYIPLPTVASTKRKAAEVRECSPEILPPPKRASVALSKSSGFSPAPSTPSIPLDSPVGEIEEQAPELPEAPPEPPLVSTFKPISKSDTVFIPDKAWKKEQTDEQNKTGQENNFELNKTESPDDVFEGDESGHSEESDTDTSEENTQTEPDVIYISDSPISEDAELFGEAEDIKPEIKVESRMEIKQSPGENQEKDSFEVLMSELDNEDAISVDRLETAILSDGDLSWTGAIADTASPMKPMSEVRKDEMPGTSSIQERLERCLSPRKKEQSPAPPTPVPMPSPVKTETEMSRSSKLDALLASNSAQKPKEGDKPWSVEEIKEVVGASLEEDVFRIRVKWIEKDTRKVRTGWVEEDVYQEWDAPLQEMIKNFFMKYGMPSSDRPEIRVGRSDEEDRTTIWSV